MELNIEKTEVMRSGKSDGEICAVCGERCWGKLHSIH